MRKAGPIRASQELAEVLALCEALGDDLPDEPSLDLAAVAEIEAELGARLPDDVLVALAFDSPTLKCATNVGLVDILDAAEDWNDGVPEGFVAIAYVYSEPFAEREEDAHGGPFEVLAIDRDTSTEFLVVSEGTSTPTTLAAHAREKIDAWFGRQENWLTVRSAVVHRPFTARLIGTIGSGPKERWAVHPKFGRGRILEVHDDKCTIEFEGGKRLKLVRSVLVEEKTPEPAAAAPRESATLSHPKWAEFATRLKSQGVDPERGFFDQADASKGHASDGYLYRRRDADARARVALSVLREVTGVRLPASFHYDESESEAWSSPEHCFARALGLRHP